MWEAMVQFVSYNLETISESTTMVGLMGSRVPEQGWRKGPWTPEEDKLLTEYVRLHREGRWSYVARSTGLNRSGKSCRLRWVNYLRPGLKRGHLTPQEEGIIIELHALWGNKWSTIARYLPGRTDNEIKNYWRTHFKKKAKPSQKEVKRKAKYFLNPKQQQTNDKEKKIESPGNQDMFLRYPNLEDQCISVIHQDVVSWLNNVTEDTLWGGLWNLGDTHAWW